MMHGHQKMHGKHRYNKQKQWPTPGDTKEGSDKDQEQRYQTTDDHPKHVISFHK